VPRLLELNEWLAAEPAWQALAAWEVSQALCPGAAPVTDDMFRFRPACSTSGGVALGAAGFLEGFGVTAGTAFDSLQFGAGREVIAVMTAGKVAGDFEVNDHVSVSFSGNASHRQAVDARGQGGQPLAYFTALSFMTVRGPMRSFEGISRQSTPITPAAVRDALARLLSRHTHNVNGVEDESSRVPGRRLPL